MCVYIVCASVRVGVKVRRASARPRAFEENVCEMTRKKINKYNQSSSQSALFSFFAFFFLRSFLYKKKQLNTKIYTWIEWKEKKNQTLRYVAAQVCYNINLVKCTRSVYAMSDRTICLAIFLIYRVNINFIYKYILWLIIRRYAAWVCERLWVRECVYHQFYFAFAELLVLAVCVCVWNAAINLIPNHFTKHIFSKCTCKIKLCTHYYYYDFFSCCSRWFMYSQYVNWLMLNYIKMTTACTPFQSGVSVYVNVIQKMWAIATESVGHFFATRHFHFGLMFYRWLQW